MSSIEERRKIIESSKFDPNKSKFVTLKKGQTMVLKFDKNKCEIVDRDYDGNGIFRKKFQYLVELPDGSERIFEAAPRWGEMIDSKLSKGHTMLEVERFNEGTNTTYSFSPA